MLCTNRTYISQTIKNNHKCNFSDFINRERIKFAQEYMSNNTELTLEVIAMESGFISASSFYKAFKKHTSCTPKIWLLNKIKENSN